jgi:monofunctional glycosyltransferase
VGVAVLGWLFAAHLGYVLALRWVNPPITWTIWCARMELRGEPGSEVRWLPVPLEKMGPHAPLAVIAAEDQEFARHRGFDVGAIRDAVQYNRRQSGDRKRGGSTISQQAAKNVFLWQDRTWLRKGLEAWFTALIEAMWGKRRILEVYLNHAEMGRGVFGIEAAARHYFGKAADDLSREEAALIAAALPGPRVYSIAKPGPWLRRRQQWVLGQMRNIGGNRDIGGVLGTGG